MRFESRFVPAPAASPTDIEDRLSRRYIDRLSDKVRRMRKDLQERNWEVLKTDSRQLRSSGESFGFPGLTRLAASVESAIPTGAVSRIRPLPDARKAVEQLIAEIDSILISQSGRR